MRSDSKKSQLDKAEKEISLKRDEDESFVDINCLPAEKMREQWDVKNDCKQQFSRVSMGEGYVNPAFVGSTDELTSLEFNRSAQKHGKRFIYKKK